MKKETWTIRFLYKTVPGRIFLKGLVNPGISRLAGRFLDSRFSAWLVPLFIKKHKIDIRGCENRKYKSFNSFFIRRRYLNQIDCTPGHLISPCDGWLGVYPVSEEQTYRIKNVEYCLADLLEDRNLAEQFSGGICLIFRLTPQDYHRYCYVCNGAPKGTRRIPGKLHCVRPTAYTSLPVFVQNSREYTVIQTAGSEEMIQMEIGALLVGKIHNHPVKAKVLQGQEKGYFEFGGSTILVLLKKEQAEIAERIWRKRNSGYETRVRLGERIGTWK